MENTRRSWVFFPTSFMFYASCVLYNRTEHSRGFFICFMIKNPIISPRIRLNFQTKNETAKYRVEFERSYSYLRLEAVCSKIARTSVKVRKTKRLALPLVLLRAQKRISEQALQWPLVGSLRWDYRRTSVTTLHVSVVWAIDHFYKNKASHHKQRQRN